MIEKSLKTSREFFLNLTIALLIPCLGYYISIFFYPKINIYSSAEYLALEKISKKIAKQKEKKAILKELELNLLRLHIQDYSKLENLKKEILDIKIAIKNLKNKYKELNSQVEQKYLQSNNIKSEKVLFFLLQALGVLAILLGIFIEIRAIKSGLILGGILSITFGNLYYWYLLTDFTKIIQIFLILVFVIFITYKLYLDEDKHKTKK